MELFDYGIWLTTPNNPDPFPITHTHTFQDLPNFTLYFSGKLILTYQEEQNKFHFIDHTFQTLSASFFLKQNISNKPIYKILPKCIKKYKKLTESKLGALKSPYRKDLDSISYLLCSWNNMDSH